MPTSRGVSSRASATIVAKLAANEAICPANDQAMALRTDTPQREPCPVTTVRTVRAMMSRSIHAL